MTVGYDQDDWPWDEEDDDDWIYNDPDLHADDHLDDSWPFFDEDSEEQDWEDLGDDDEIDLTTFECGCEYCRQERGEAVDDRPHDSYFDPMDSGPDDPASELKDP